MKGVVNMANTFIRLDCVDQQLIINEAPVVASGGINDSIVEFNFSAEWNNLAKSAIIFTSKDETV